jgi:hypothetical protein
MPARRAPSRRSTSDDAVSIRTGYVTDTPITTDPYLELSAKVVEIQVLLAGLNEKLAGLPDHEARIRKLEAANARLLGACLLLSTLVGSASGWLPLIATHH